MSICGTRTSSAWFWSVALVSFASMGGTAHSQECVTWQLAASSGPSPRFLHAAAYDSTRNATVVFGGGGSAQLASSETWEWDGSLWLMKGVTGPIQRVQHAMTYDTVRQRTLLFGGYDGTSNLGDTWEWNGASWENRSYSGPTPRDAHAMAFDVTRGQAVLFGGSVSSGAIGDTWEWNGNSWTLRSATGPSARFFHAMAYDSARGKVVLFGGTVDGTVGGMLADTWEWDGKTWQQVANAGPAPRHKHAMVYDAARDRVVMFGGQNGAVAFDDTWEWDGKMWQAMPSNGLSLRSAHVMTYDIARSRVVLFGGYDGNFLGDTWERIDGTWSLREPVGPSIRYGHTMAYDEARQVMVMYGGLNDATSGNETWEWDGATWVQRFPANSPPYLYQHIMVYDANRGRIVLQEKAPGIATWEYDGVNWTSFSNPNPGPRLAATMTYDRAQQKTLIIGGASGSQTYERTTWERDGILWTLRSMNEPPESRVSSAAAFSADLGRTVLYGGDWFGSKSDTWTWDGSTWVQLMIAGPPARSRHVMASEFDRPTVVMFGGRGDNSFPKGDTWQFDGTAWTQIGSTGPLPRYDTAMAYDSIRDRVVLFGGLGSPAGIGYGDTWELVRTTAPIITDQPDGQSASIGQAITMFVATDGSLPQAFQWRRNGQPLVNGGPISGADSPTLIIDPVSQSDSGAYDVMISNSCGSVVSDTAQLAVVRCTADIDESGSVNVSDLLLVVQLWGPCFNFICAYADIAPPGGNHAVNVEDLLAVISAWGACP